MTDLLANLLLALFGGIVGYFLNLWAARKQEERDKRRKLYESLADSMRVFIDDENITPQESDLLRQQFSQAYARSWLWGNDRVIIELNKFLQLVNGDAANSSINDQQLLKEQFARCSLAMRRNLGFFFTKLEPKQYHFFSFKSRNNNK